MSSTPMRSRSLSAYGGPVADRPAGDARPEGQGNRVPPDPHGLAVPGEGARGVQKRERLPRPEMNLGQIAREIERHVDAARGHPPSSAASSTPPPNSSRSLEERAMSSRTGTGRTGSRISSAPAAGTGRSSTARLRPSTRWAGRRRRRSLSRVSAAPRGPRATSSPTRSTPPTAGHSRLPPVSRWQTRPARGRLHGRRRHGGHRRQPLHPCLPAQHRPHGGLHEQPDLRHDRRAGQPDNAQGLPLVHHPVRVRRDARSISASSRPLRGPTMSPAGPRIMSRSSKKRSKWVSRPPGFSFIEALVQCPTAFGRRNKFRQVTDHVEYLRSTRS